MSPRPLLLLTVVLFCLGSVHKAEGQDQVYASEFNQNNNEFGTINLYTGTFTPIGSYGNVLINDIAYAPDGVLYGIENSASLVTFNLQSGAISTVANFNVGGLESLAIQPSTGTLFAATQGALYTVNPTTAVATEVGAFGTPTGLDDNGQNIRFASDGDLYDTNTSTNGTSTGLYRLSLTSGAATYLGEVVGYPNLALANAGSELYGVSINVTNSATIDQTLVQFNLSTLGDGSLPHDINAIALDGQSNIPPNYNFSGDQNAAAPDAAPEPPTYLLLVFGLGVALVAHRKFPARATAAGVGFTTRRRRVRMVPKNEKARPADERDDAGTRARAAGGIGADADFGARTDRDDPRLAGGELR